VSCFFVLLEKEAIGFFNLVFVGTKHYLIISVITEQERKQVEYTAYPVISTLACFCFIPHQFKSQGCSLPKNLNHQFIEDRRLNRLFHLIHLPKFLRFDHLLYTDYLGKLIHSDSPYYSYSPVSILRSNPQLLWFSG